MMNSRSKLSFCLLFALSPFSSAFFLKDFASKSQPTSNPLVPELENLITMSRSGIDDSYKEGIQEIMVEISKSRSGDQRDALTGSWELIYTTEKEVNFFKTSWPFAKVSSITQNIDVDSDFFINNSINFESGGKFAVTGCTKRVDGDDEYDRIAFEFQEAVATVWGKDLKLPPIGTGWFDTMFCNDNIRLSRDLRGDWSVFRRTE